MQRIFLNWDKPILETAADYLVNQYIANEQIDMRKVLIVVTGAQAKRRLEELLQHKATAFDPAWFPPERITTIGSFPELLYPQKNPAANDLVQQLAWSTALDKLSRRKPDAIKRLIDQPPTRNDWQGRLALGKLISQLHLELAADRVDFGVVVGYCRAKQLPEEAERWDVLAELQTIYLRELDEVKLWDIQTARAFALEHDECKTDCDTVLVGLSDLNRMQRAMLDAIGERVTSLVFAPESLADLFDEHGCVDAERWYVRPLDIPDDAIVMADTPIQQATAVLHWLQQLTELSGRSTGASYSAQDIVIGVPDESVVPFLSQQLGQVGIPHRLTAGIPITRTPVYLLLESLANYLQSRHYSDLLTLLRHPDMERYVNFRLQTSDLGIQEPEVRNPQSEASWLMEFDTYYCDHLPLVVGGKWLPRPRRESDDDSDLDVMHETENPPSPQNKDRDETSPQLPDREYHLVKAVYDIIENLIVTTVAGNEAKRSDRNGGENAQLDTQSHSPVTPFAALTAFPAAVSCDITQGLGEWVEAVKRLLSQLYDWLQTSGFRLQEEESNANPEVRSPKPETLSNHIIEKSFEQLERLYEKLESVPKPLSPTMTAADILTLLLRMWAPERIAPLAHGDEIELLGWLELLTDDAPAVAITGFNEGIVPSSKSADLFLPDGMRRELRLDDNMRRYARDAYALSAIVAGRSTGMESRVDCFAGVPAVKLIFGKRSIEGDPLVPSRLLFATDEQHIAERVHRFFAEPSPNATRPLFAGSLRAGSDRSDFDPKEPPKSGYPFNRIRVTEFRDYLQCPFRYYLKHRLRLDITDDTAEELDGGAFGDLAHRVLKLFGRSKIKNSQDAGQIAEYLSRQLDTVAADAYGKAFRPVIDVQVEQLRFRLNAFAVAQAKRAAEGFEILHVEYSPTTGYCASGINDGSMLVDVDGRPIKIRGRIDRVDFDHNSGKYVLLDYKTAAAGDAPEKTHRNKGEWVDLQLPLYEWIFSEHNDIESEIEVGYVSLPKDVTKTGFLIADWHYNDFETARNTAKEVIRNIRREVFWPPTKPAPKYSEIYSSICNDRQMRLEDDEDDDDDGE